MRISMITELQRSVSDNGLVDFEVEIFGQAIIHSVFTNRRSECLTKILDQHWMNWGRD